MSAEEMESMLRAAPTRSLSPGAQRQIISAILAADRGRRHWWSRRVPLWQSLAACVAVCVLTVAGDSVSPRTPGPVDVSPDGSARAVQDRAATQEFIRLDPSILGWAGEPPYRTDISRWSEIESPREGEPTP